ncbi:MAG: hypothetical protein HW405_990 [Candidatus Berkelbacteria bacterium]|nr:hypothetical protein [Candidatus Berkelbacteria bacterium]
MTYTRDKQKQTGGAMNSNTVVIPGKISSKAISKSNKTANKQKAVAYKSLGIKIGVFVLVFAMLFGGSFGYTRVYSGKIYPKVIVAGVKIGGMTLGQARAAVTQKAQELNDMGPTITYNNQTLNPELNEMGVTFNIDEVTNLAYNFGRQGGFKDQLRENYKIFSQGYQVNITPQIDEAKFNDYLGQLAKVAEKEPASANLKIYNGQITLINSEMGRGLDKEKLKEDLTNFINSGKNGQIVMVTSDLEPKVVDENTNDARTKAERYMSLAPITVNFEDKIWTADKSEIGTWIKFAESDRKLVASIDPNHFVNSISNSVEIATKDKEMEDGTGKVLNEGQDGRGVDKNTLKSQIIDASLGGQANTSFALITFTVAKGQTTIYPHAQPGRFAGRYIDINLSEQTLYAFEGNTIVNQFLISSGKRGYATPTGEYSVWGKTRSQLMDGPDYYLPNVPWISWFNGEISIHGTYWHDNFGTPMSHGCINASIPDAEWVYNFIEVGSPVYVHY